MSIKSKKILSILSYYTLAVLAFIMAVLTIMYVVNRDVPTWASILYIFWAVIVIGTLIFDIICTSLRHMKFISGIIVYILSVVSIIVTVILYLVRAGLATGLTTTFMPIYIGVAALIMSTTLYMIATYIVGESLVEHTSALKSIKQNNHQ